MTQAKESIKGLMDNGLSTDRMPDDLEERWRSMGNRYLQWNTQLDNAKDAALTAEKALDRYCEQHPLEAQKVFSLHHELISSPIFCTKCPGSPKAIILMMPSGSIR